VAGVEAALRGDPASGIAAAAFANQVLDARTGDTGAARALALAVLVLSGHAASLTPY